jgi:hypothetical protein
MKACRLIFHIFSCHFMYFVVVLSYPPMSDAARNKGRKSRPIGQRWVSARLSEMTGIAAQSSTGSAQGSFRQRIAGRNPL